ncbi:DnaD domain protein [Paraclostridium bifermentans]|uniref:DnaD domain protein n=1 Tax=Paraclostridium bifermentans TaxID=1490 RepID=UPI0018AADCA1|nr:DnaD domain protein [Paraclostridium bifermentans]
MFFKEVNEIDLGQTTIDNIFIDIFMPMANGLYVQVYLLGYRYACDETSNPKFNNNSIAKNLNVPLSDVLAAWDFWEDKNLIKKHKNDGLDDFSFSIEFLDLKKIYIDNILNANNSVKSDVNAIVSINDNPEIRKMFNSINQIIGRHLQSNEKITIMDMIDKYNMSTEMIVCAYEHVKEQTGVAKPVSYVEGIIRNWYDASLYTVEDVKNSFAQRSKRFMMYKTVFNELGFSRQATKAEKEIMDVWFDKYEFDIELILEACSKSKNISNPSIAYINGIVKSWNDKNIKTLEDLKTSEEEFKKQSESKKVNSKSSNAAPKQVKTRFHNINQTFTKYSPDELEKILQESQKGKFR